MKIEKFKDNIIFFFQKHRIELLVGIVIGLLTYGYFLLNKIPNNDDITCIVGFGSTAESGRWGLAILESIFYLPSGIPWISGITTILIFDLSICLLIDSFEIHNTVTKCLFMSVIISFPSITGMMTYMFTTVPYAISCFLAMLSASILINSKNKYRAFQAIILLVGSLSIYQANIAITAGALVVYSIKELLECKTSNREIIKNGLIYIGALIISMVLYFGVSVIILKIFHRSFNEYSTSKFAFFDFTKNIVSAYVHFFKIFVFGENCIITTLISRITHIVVCAFFLLILIVEIVKIKDVIRKILLVLGIILFPLSCCSMYLLFSDGIHTIVLTGMISIYLLIIVLEKYFCEYHIFKEAQLKIVNGSVIFLLMVTMLSNIYTANLSYYRMQLKYNNAIGFFTSMITQIQQQPGFDEDSIIAIIGNAPENDSLSIMGNNKITGTNNSIINGYSRELFLNRYLDFNPKGFADEESKEKIRKSDEFVDMPCYPYYGSIKGFDNNIIVIKLSD